MAEVATSMRGFGSPEMPKHISMLQRGVSTGNVRGRKPPFENADNSLESGKAEAKAQMMKRAATTSNLLGCEPSSADGFDVLFGRVETWKPCTDFRATSSFD
eukprot:3256511-Rhodomonas_salina.1